VYWMYLGNYDVHVEESFLNWGYMYESDTRSQSYGQNTITHSKIAQIRLDHDFLPILH
jgi:hypothetical protein